MQTLFEKLIEKTTLDQANLKDFLKEVSSEAKRPPLGIKGLARSTMALTIIRFV